MLGSVGHCTQMHTDSGNSQMYSHTWPRFYRVFLCKGKAQFLNLGKDSSLFLNKNTTTSPLTAVTVHNKQKVF